VKGPALGAGGNAITESIQWHKKNKIGRHLKKYCTPLYGIFRVFQTATGVKAPGRPHPWYPTKSIVPHTLDLQFIVEDPQ